MISDEVLLYQVWLSRVVMGRGDVRSPGLNRLAWVHLTEEARI